MSRPCRARCDAIVFIHQDESLTSCQGFDEIRDPAMCVFFTCSWFTCHSHSIFLGSLKIYEPLLYSLSIVPYISLCFAGHVWKITRSSCTAADPSI